MERERENTQSIPFYSNLPKSPCPCILLTTQSASYFQFNVSQWASSTIGWAAQPALAVERCKKANDFHWISTNGHWTGRIHSALNPHLNNATVLHCHSVHNVQNVNKLLSFLFSSSPFLSRSSSSKLLFRLFTFQECISFKFVPAFYFYLWLHKNPLHQLKLKGIQNVANNRF